MKDKDRIKQLEKQIDVVGAFYHLEGQTIFQEIALYKIDIENVYVLLLM